MKAKYLILFIVVSSFTVSCREKMDVSVDETYTRLIVNGSITTDTMQHSVKLAKSANYFSNKPVEPVSNAIVFFTEGSDTFKLKENPSKPGEYLTDSSVYGIEGKTYFLSIKNADVGNGQTEYNAKSYLPKCAEIDSFKIVRAEFNWGPAEDRQWEIKLYARDPIETVDFYLFNVYRNGVLLSDSLFKLTSTNDDLFNGSYTNGIALYHIVEKYEKSQGILFVEKGYDAKDDYSIEISAITEDCFNFTVQMQQNYMGSNPIFGGAPANVVTNIYPVDNAVGFFSAKSSKRKSNLGKK